jgi:hypothetical protein
VQVSSMAAIYDHTYESYISMVTPRISAVSLANFVVDDDWRQIFKKIHTPIGIDRTSHMEQARNDPRLSTLESHHQSVFLVCW